FVTKRVAAPYRLSYRAPASGPKTRNVALTMNGSSAKTSGKYTLPADPQPARALSGIYLEIQVGPTSVVRTLAGFRGPGQPKAPLPQSLYDEVRAALFGTTVVSFEGGAPSFSTWVSDLLSAALLGEPAFHASQSGDMKQFTDALSMAQTVTI